MIVVPAVLVAAVLDVAAAPPARLRPFRLSQGRRTLLSSGQVLRAAVAEAWPARASIPLAARVVAAGREVQSSPKLPAGAGAAGVEVRAPRSDARNQVSVNLLRIHHTAVVPSAVVGDVVDAAVAGESRREAVDAREFPPEEGWPREPKLVGCCTRRRGEEHSPEENTVARQH